MEVEGGVATVTATRRWPNILVISRPEQRSSGQRHAVSPRVRHRMLLALQTLHKTEGRAVLPPGWEESGRSLLAGPQSLHREAPMVGLSF